MKRLIASLLMILLTSSPAHSSLGEPYESEARASLQKLKDSSTDAEVFKRISMVAAKQNQGLVMECDLIPEKCTVGNLLLFRGEGRFSLPAISGIVRTLWSGSQYAKGKSLSQAFESLDRDLSVFADITSAPGNDSSFKSDRVVLGQNQKSHLWAWWMENEANDEHSASKTLYKTIPKNLVSRLEGQLNFRQLLYTFHVTANYLHYHDPVLKRAVSIDPLVSFTTSPRTALAYAKAKGVLHVISVPITEFKSLCSRDPLIPGEVWSAKDCAEDLNPFATYGEYEYDVVAYPKLEHIRYRFLIN